MGEVRTIGLPSQSDRIIEIAALDAHTGESFVRLINPGRSIPAEASTIHKISDAMIQSAPSFDLTGQESLQLAPPRKRAIKQPSSLTTASDSTSSS